MDNKIYLPVILNNYTPEPYIEIVKDSNKGIALVTNILDDLGEVGAEWYYTWTSYPVPTSDIRYIPMSYSGLFDERLPVDYDGFVLFLNEPNNIAPFGADLDPIVSAVRYRDFVLARPNVKLVVGNTSAWASMWHYDFMQTIKSFGDVPFPKYVGLHGYVEEWVTADYLDNMWNNIYIGYKSFNSSVEVWITEFADTAGNTESLQNILNIFNKYSWITRYAYFTNRYDPEAEYIPDGWHDFGLFENGLLSPVGKTYRIFS